MVRNAEAQFLCCVLNDATGDHSAFHLEKESSVQQLYDQVAHRFQLLPNSFQLQLSGHGSETASAKLTQERLTKLKDIGFVAEVDFRNQVTLIMAGGQKPEDEDAGDAPDEAIEAKEDTTPAISVAEDGLSIANTSAPTTPTISEANQSQGDQVIGDKKAECAQGEEGLTEDPSAQGAAKVERREWRRTRTVRDRKEAAAPPPDPPPPPPVTVQSADAAGDSAASANWQSTATYQFPSPSLNAVPFVGLVNQAMTCYLNSLLQALFMTPEFRNALYHWKYDPGEQGSELPLELQKLFLKLQTSSCAVETTALTKSFGWNSSEAWQQHDVQELCRLLFDELERQFKGTDQADLINRLYQGSMLDYVKCLECSTERHREDKFLDIPLAVRPFGSNAAYGSVEEALRAFVQPETLDGSNQYHCEKCNKKCDAHKGLKFTKFPYLLTLHLKRFDFDYNTLNRIKLNDKVSFPYTLNLNGFVKNTLGNGIGEIVEEIVKSDDCSTTDSGSALDEDATDTPGTAAHSNHTDSQEEDEGVDVSNAAESEKNRANAPEPGPYNYELFSIMIHSGSASGGHYYAYIKDFATGEWFCFNDQSVYRIKKDDIEKTYGGGNRYYSSTYYSSTNAYMLMYRQIDLERNAHTVTKENFPPHLHEQLGIIEEQRIFNEKRLQSEKEMIKIKCYHRRLGEEKLKLHRLFNKRSDSLRAILKDAMQLFNLEGEVPIERCRLVSYDSDKDAIECSFEGKDGENIGEIMGSCYKDELLLQVRGVNESWTTHRIGDISTKVMVIDPVTEEVEPPVNVDTNEDTLVRQYRIEVAQALRCDPANTHLFADPHRTGCCQLLTADEKTLKESRIGTKERVYVFRGPLADVARLEAAALHAKDIVNLHINLPLVTKEILQDLNIPSWEEQKPDSPQPLSEADYSGVCGASGGDDPLAGASSDQSASEDSSLTDSERTIVGDAPGSPDISPRVSPVFDGREMEPLHVDSGSINASPRITLNSRYHATDSDDEYDYQYFRPKRVPGASPPKLEALVHKRIRLYQLKKLLEPLVNVPQDYFKVFRISNGSDQEIGRLDQTFLLTAQDDDIIDIRLGRAARRGELSGRVYLLDITQEDPKKFLFNWVIGPGAQVSQVKKELLGEARSKCQIDIPYNRCRLRLKKWSLPAVPYLDGSTITDINANWEMYIQELQDVDPLTSSEQRLVFVRRWCPSTRQLEPFTEYLLESDLLSELIKQICEKSAIPRENLELAAGRTSFPCKLKTRDIHSDLDWQPAASFNDDDLVLVYPISSSDSSGVIFYRDNRERLKQLTHEEQREQLQKEEGKKSSSIIRKREKTLRICAEPPKPDSDFD